MINTIPVFFYLQHFFLSFDDSSFFFSVSLFIVILFLLFSPLLFSWHSMMSFVMLSNTSLTLISLFALVSKNFIPFSSASFFPSSVETWRSDKSHLLPINIFWISSEAFSFISFSQVETLLKEFLDVISYPMMKPSLEWN